MFLLVLLLINSITWWYVIVKNLMGFIFVPLKAEFVNTIEGQHTELSAPRSVAVSSTGQLFVTDVSKNCVHVFQ